MWRADYDNVEIGRLEHLGEIRERFAVTQLMRGRFAAGALRRPAAQSDHSAVAVVLESLDVLVGNPAGTDDPHTIRVHTIPILPLKIERLGKRISDSEH
jgi:hypothetical protein